MNRQLSKQDRHDLDTLVSDTEKRTGSQIVLAVIRRCDSYTELPWKAFAAGAASAGLLIAVLNLLILDWHAQWMILFTTGGMLMIGAFCALLTILIPAFAKCFLSADRVETEVRQYAAALFLERELFATRNRTGILILISLFERKIIILPDKGLSGKLTDDLLQQILRSMSPLMKLGRTKQAFEAGLKEIARVLETTGSGQYDNELPDDIIEEEGV